MSRANSESVTFGPEDVLFVGMGASTVAWYRCFMPAIFLDCDWVGFHGQPPHQVVKTGAVGRMAVNSVDMDAAIERYKVVVVQQPHTNEWLRWIKKAQQGGTVVFYEVDDDLHAVAERYGHTNSDRIRRNLGGYERCMKQADAIITSTEHLAWRLRKLNDNIFVCPNALDLHRYNVSRPARDYVTIGFAGGIGHEQTLKPWLNVINDVVIEKGARFMSIGTRYADHVEGGLNIPFMHVEQFPGALCNFDIVLAPGGVTDFYKSKSELRWMEAGALGLPVIASDYPYTSMRHGIDGIRVNNNDEFYEWLRYLVEDAEARDAIGTFARKRIHEEYDINNGVEAWVTAFEAMT